MKEMSNTGGIKATSETAENKAVENRTEKAELSQPFEHSNEIGFCNYEVGGYYSEIKSSDFDKTGKLSDAQQSVEFYCANSIQRILNREGKYISEKSKERITRGIDSIYAVPYYSDIGGTGCYKLHNNKSSVEVKAFSEEQMERTTNHEINHFMSCNKELIVPQNGGGHYVYKTVGLRESRYFTSKEGLKSDYETHGRGLNEGLTTLYSNRQLMEISSEKGLAAQREEIYKEQVELCGMLEKIVGETILKEAYYGGDVEGLKKEIDILGGDKAFENLRDSMDRTLTRDPVERERAMKEVNKVLAKMFEEKRLN